MMNRAYLVAVDDGLQAVGDSDDGGVGELVADGGLDEGIGAHVNVGRRLVQHQDAVVLQDGAREADELPLAQAQVGTATHSTASTGVRLWWRRVAALERAVSGWDVRKGFCFDRVTYPLSETAPCSPPSRSTASFMCTCRG